MKRNHIAIIAALPFVLAGCVKEINNADEGLTVIGAVLPEDATESQDGKTSLGDKTGSTYSILWTAGDQISVNGCPSSPLEEISADGKSGQFEINGVIAAPFCGVYPLSAVDNYVGGKYTVTVPSNQTYTAGSFDPAAAVMLAYGSGTSISFQNALAYLKLTVNKDAVDATVKSVRVTANGSEAMSGTFEASFGETCSLDASANGAGVTLDCGNGVALGSDFIIAIPAKTYATGIVINVFDTDGNYQKMTSSGSFTAVAGKIYSTSFNYSVSGEATTGIWTEEDLIAFLNAADGDVECTNYNSKKDKSEAAFGNYDEWVSADGKVHICADITLTQNVDWSSTASKRSCTVSNFDGWIDGEGHTITVSGTWRTPMFINLYGKITNLTLAGAVTANHAPDLCSPFVAVVQEGGVLDGCTNRASVTYSTDDQAKWSKVMVGGLAIRIEGGTVTNCVNYGTLTLGGLVIGPESDNTVARVGGISVYVNAGGTMSNCTNYGEINTSILRKEALDSETGAYWAGSAGIVSYCEPNSVLTGCYNRATVFNTGTARYIGGIVSSARTSGISNCHNYCPIVQSSDNKTTTIGGVINWLGAGYEMSGCSNNASITVGGCKSTGGVICSLYASTVKNCTNNGTFVLDGNRNSVYAGVCREVLEGGVLENCTNAADIVVNSAYGSGVCSKNIGTVKGCINTGAISFAQTIARAGAVVYDNQGLMEDCVNNGAISCDQKLCNMAGIACINSYPATGSNKGVGAIMRNCVNNGAINITAGKSRAAGVCFNMQRGSIIGCENNADILIDFVPDEAAMVEFLGGIVGVVSENNLAGTNIQNIFGSGKGSYGPLSVYNDNTLSTKLAIEDCTNTGHVKIISKPVSTASYLRNVAIGGILAWNWAATTADNYLEIKNCTNGVPTATSGTAYYYIQFQQENHSPDYLAPALGGIVGQSAPYDCSGSYSFAPHTAGWALSPAKGMKIVIDGCKAYGAVVDMESYSGSAGLTHRMVRAAGGIGGLVYGSTDEGQSAVVKNCRNVSYVFRGNTKGKNGTSPMSRSNCCGGIVGSGANIDIDNCISKGQVGSNTRFVLATGGIMGSCVERFSITNCTIEMPMGYANYVNKRFYGLAVGIINSFAARSQGLGSLSGSVISNNVFKPGKVSEFIMDGMDNVVQEQHYLDINSSNFQDYIISASDAADNATNGWLTLSGNTWGGE